MANLIFILEFFGGVILLFGLGWVVGHLFRLDNRYKYFQNNDKDINSDNPND
jgi:hypothetical protein